MLGMLFLLAANVTDIGFQISLNWPNAVINVNVLWIVGLMALLLVWHALSGRIGRGDRH